jgi:hypothetical protein
MTKNILRKLALSIPVQFILTNFTLTTLRTLVFVRFMNSLNANLKRKGFVASISVRPPESLQLVDRSNVNPTNQDWGVVYHGKIVNQRTLDFLVSNITTTREVSREITIVVSVYEDEYFLPLQNRVRDLGVVLIKCQDVGELTGDNPRSLCQQIETINSGLMFLQEAGISKSMKIRVDQKINIETTVRLVDSLFLAFPSQMNSVKNRIWTTSYNSYLRRPFGASDMIMVGFTQDLLEYWSKISTVHWMEYTEKIKRKNTHPIYAEFRVPETWLGARYLESKNVDLTSPIKANHVFWQDFLGVINSAHLNHSWLKTYEWLGSNFHTLNWFGNLLSYELSEITFEDWLAIYGER